MITSQPVLSLKNFRFRKNKITKGIKRLFYLSWEDALWDILIKRNVAKGSYILIPDFYCVDVESNIKKHGYKVAHYKILPNLKADKDDFENKINKFNPAVVVIFHPVGIKTNLMNNVEWLKKATGNRFLVEDCVHRIIEPNEIEIIKKNHFVIDSLRKVLPLQGSNVYGRTEDLDFSAPPFYQSFFYSVKVKTLWFLMVLAWSFKFGKIAERLMVRGYNLIGDSKLPARGGFISKFLSIRINIKKIRNIKKRQASYYERKLGSVLPQKLLISESNKRNIRGYPVILHKKNAAKIVEKLRINKIFVRLELEGSKWTKKQKIIYLPLGPQLTEDGQKRICELSYNTLNAEIK